VAGPSRRRYNYNALPHAEEPAKPASRSIKQWVTLSGPWYEMLDHHIAIDSQNDYNSQLTKWLYQPSCEPTPQFDADRHRNGLISWNWRGQRSAPINRMPQQVS
jgi:hypothetical protein